MLHRIAFVLLLLGIAPMVSAQDEWKRAADLYKKGQYQDARILLEESIQSTPDWWYPVFLMGQCNLKLNNYKGALENFNDTLTLEVDSKTIPQVKYGIARAYMGMKDYPKAVHAYTELEKIVPASKKFDVYYNRGQAELQIGKQSTSKDRRKASEYFSKAVVSFSQALENPSKSQQKQIEASFQKAWAQYQIGNFQGSIDSLEKSIQAFKDVIAENPKEKRAHTFIVNLSFELVDKSSDAQKVNRWMDSVEYINRYLSHWPGDLKMINRKGQALQGAKKYKEAITVFQTLVSKNPKDEGLAYFSLGSCQMADKQYKAAINSFKKAISQGQKENPSAYSYASYCYQEQKNGCESNDIPLYTNAVKILEEGISSIGGQAKAVLQKDLEQKKGSLDVLKGNLETEKQNHLAVIENIKALQKTIEGNKVTLAKNQDLYLQQPTDELKQAIDASKKAITEDTNSLSGEFEQLNKYLAAAKKCGGAKAYPSYSELTALKKTQN